MRTPWMRVVLWWATAVVGLLPWGTAAAQVHQIRILDRQCDATACRVASGSGSAVAIGRHRSGQELFLTAGHCVRGPVERVEVGIGGQWRRATVLGSTMTAGQDAAVLAVVHAGPPLRCAPVAPADAQPGASVTLCGFPRGTAYRSRTGPVVAHSYRDVDLVVALPTIPGESGGGIFDEAGRLVGIISATAPADHPTHTLATGATRLRAFLERTTGGVPDCGGSISAPPVDDTALLLAEIERLRSRLTALESRPSVPGPPGPKGDPGPPAALPADLRRRLERLEQTEIPVQVLAPDGTILDQQRYRLGQPIPLRLIPHRPAGTNK